MTAAVSVLVFAFTIEFLQYMDFVNVIGMSGNKVVSTVIGQSFDVRDLLAYTAGVVIVFGIDSWLSRSNQEAQ